MVRFEQPSASIQPTASATSSSVLMPVDRMTDPPASAASLATPFTNGMLVISPEASLNFVMPRPARNRALSRSNGEDMNSMPMARQ